MFGSKEGYFHCYRKAINSVGVYLPKEKEEKIILSLWSKTNLEEIKGLLSGHPELVDKAYQNFEKFYWGEDFTSKLKVEKETKDLLKRLNKEYILAVATSGNARIIREKFIPTLGIPNVFQEILSSEEMGDVSKMKPHPLILFKIMEKFKINKTETAYVGDSPTDMKMAQTAQVLPIAVLSGLINQKSAQQMGVKNIIQNVAKLEEVLKKPL